MTICDESVATSRALHQAFIAGAARAVMIPPSADAAPFRKGST